MPSRANNGFVLKVAAGVLVVIIGAVLTSAAAFCFHANGRMTRNESNIASVYARIEGVDKDLDEIKADIKVLLRRSNEP